MQAARDICRIALGLVGFLFLGLAVCFLVGWQYHTSNVIVIGLSIAQMQGECVIDLLAAGVGAIGFLLLAVGYVLEGRRKRPHPSEPLSSE